MERRKRYRGKNINCAGRPKKDYEPLTNDLSVSVSNFYNKQLPLIYNYCWCYSQMFKNVTQGDVLGYFEELIVTHVAGTRKPIDEAGYYEFTRSIARSILNNLIKRKWYNSYDFASETDGYYEEGDYYNIFDKKFTEINFIEHIMEDEHNSFIIEQIKKCLNDQEKAYIEYYFTDECRQNSSEVGRKFGCTRQNADYIIKRALDKLTKKFKEIF